VKSQARPPPAGGNALVTFDAQLAKRQAVRAGSLHFNEKTWEIRQKKGICDNCLQDFSGI
jgi:hypothetical protein